MDEIIRCKLNNAKQIALNNQNNIINEIKKLEYSAEEAFLFQPKSRNTIIGMKKTNNTLNSEFERKYTKLNYNKLFYEEIDKIDTFIYIQDDIDEILSPYGSFYCGDGKLFYNDTLCKLSDIQLLNVLAIHFIHYTNMSFLYDSQLYSNKECETFNYNVIVKSLKCLNLISSEIKNKDKNNIFKSAIIFNIKKSNLNFIIKNKIKSSFFAINGNIFNGIDIALYDTFISINYYHYDIISMKYQYKHMSVELNKNFGIIDKMVKNLRNKIRIDNKIYNTLLKYSNHNLWKSYF